MTGDLDLASDAGGAAGPVVLFDGSCALCHAAVRFVIRHDRVGRIRFAALQSGAGARLLGDRGRAVPPGPLESVLLVEGAEVHARSDAALRIARYLDGAWPVLYGLVVVPRPLRDAAYRVVARHRGRWPGGAEGCRLPGSEPGGRFLE